MSTTTHLTESDLKKLTIPQLKALCKAKQISGYSKATKATLIDKLLLWQKSTCPENNSSPPVDETPKAHDQGLDAQNQDPDPRSGANANDHDHDHDLCPVHPVPPPEQGSGDRLPLCVDVQNVPHVQQLDGTNYQRDSAQDPVLTSEPQPRTAPPSDIPYQPPTQLRQEAVALKRRQDNPAVPGLGKKSRPDTTPTVGLPSRRKPVAGPEPVTPSLAPSRPFKALVPSSRILHQQPTSSTATGIARPTESARLPSGTSLPSLAYLDFADEEHTVHCAPIGFPPSVSQRKRVASLSLAFTALDDKSLSACTQASRLLRYSVYASAVHRLKRLFPGLRLERQLKRYPSNSTNFWPYLRFRMKERKTRLEAYQSSFLFHAFRPLFEIAPTLWASPDHPKQITIALRFLLTKFFFVVSAGFGLSNGPSIDGLKLTVLDAEEIIPSEVWVVSVRLTTGVEKYYVLEDTCEVIGPWSHTTNGVIRSDWAAYISSRISEPEAPGMQQHIRWVNHEEYSKGISKIWLSSMQEKGKEGVAKLKVARRYVLASTFANSISGRWMSSGEMAQTFNGLTSAVDSREPRKLNLNLFVPVHHHVESVHFTCSRGGPLHAALAVVQTPAREYYILKDNGMQVGTEEEGVSLVWATLLNCDSNGRA